MTTNRELFAKHVGLGNFVETGSCEGRSIAVAVDLGFSDIRSVEGSEERYSSCVNKFASLKHVKLWNGESVVSLPVMLMNLGPSLVFLDAHPSGDGSFGQDYEQHPEHRQSAILQAELEIIHQRNVKGDVILIDDLTEDIEEFATKLFLLAKIEVHDTNEGPRKVMEIQT